jgi:hypothetical protein
MLLVVITAFDVACGVSIGPVGIDPVVTVIETPSGIAGAEGPISSFPGPFVAPGVSAEMPTTKPSLKGCPKVYFPMLLVVITKAGAKSYRLVVGPISSFPGPFVAPGVSAEMPTTKPSLKGCPIVYFPMLLVVITVFLVVVGAEGPISSFPGPFVAPGVSAEMPTTKPSLKGCPRVYFPMLLVVITVAALLSLSSESRLSAKLGTSSS